MIRIKCAEVFPRDERRGVCAEIMLHQRAKRDDDSAQSHRALVFPDALAAVAAIQMNDFFSLPRARTDGRNLDEVIHTRWTSRPSLDLRRVELFALLFHRLDCPPSEVIECALRTEKLGAKTRYS
jgi:hypothetical protein